MAKRNRSLYGFIAFASNKHKMWSEVVAKPGDQIQFAAIVSWVMKVLDSIGVWEWISRTLSSAIW